MTRRAGIAWFTGTGAGAIVDWRIAWRLWVYAITDSVIAFRLSAIATVATVTAAIATAVSSTIAVVVIAVATTMSVVTAAGTKRVPVC